MISRNELRYTDSRLCNRAILWDRWLSTPWRIWG